MKFIHKKFFGGFKKICSGLLVCLFIFSTFSTLLMNNTASAATTATPAETVSAVKVKDLPTYNPYFVQEVLLEPNTEYVFSYLYSGAPASATVALKGSNQKTFNGQVQEHYDEDYKRVSLTFKTTDSTDSEAVIDSATGKIKAYVGIRNYSSNTTVKDTYFADFKLYKKSDATKNNIFTNTDFSSIGSTSLGSKWNAFPSTYFANNFYERADVDKETFKNPTPKFVGVKVKDLPTVNPYFVNEVWLEPNTEYVFSYLYSAGPASTAVALKGNAEKKFTGQITEHYDEDYNRVSLTFKTTDATDSEAVIDSATGKIKAYVGIRNYSTNTAVKNNYFADFKLYKKSDTTKDNLLTDPQFKSIGSTASGSKWTAFPTAYWDNNYYERAVVEKSEFENPTPKFVGVKVKDLPSYNPYFVNEVLLEPNTEYVFTYVYNAAPANATVALKGSNQKQFESQVTVDEDEDDFYRVTLTFRTTDATDSEATVDTATGKIKAYVGIRNYSSNTAVKNNYFAGFKLYKKSDTTNDNLLTDPQFKSIGSTASGSKWTAFPAAYYANNIYERVVLDKNTFKVAVSGDTGVIKIAKATNSAYIGQWVELEKGATYYTTFCFTPNVDAEHLFLGKNDVGKYFVRDSIVYSSDKLKATVKFTVSADSVTDAYATSIGYTGSGVMVYVGFKAGALDNGYIYDWKLFKEGDDATNLFNDQDISRLGKKGWHSEKKEKPNTRFSITSLAAIGGISEFDIPDVTSDSGEYVLKSDGGEVYYIIQPVSLTPGKNYKFSYYYSGVTASRYCMFTSPNLDSGSIKDNVVDIVKDEDYNKLTVEFTAPNIGQYDAKEDPSVSGNVIVYLGVRAVKGKTQYFYKFRLYESTKTENDNLFFDNDFEYFGYKWKQRYYENLPAATRVRLDSLEGGIETFKHTDYVLRVKGVNDWSPFFLQKVSLKSGTTYSFSFYHSDVTSKSEMYSGNAAVLIEKGVYLADEYFESVVNDKLEKKTTTTFVAPQAGEDNVIADPDNPGNVIMYVGFRYYGEDQYDNADLPLCFHKFKLWETDTVNAENILKDPDFDLIGKYWFQYYFESYPYFFSQVELSTLDGGSDYFKKSFGPDISVPLGDKMMTYGSEDGGGTLYIDLPYSVNKNQSDGKYYILSIDIRPTEGKAPASFVCSTYSGGTAAIQPISVDGYTYTFFVQERYNFRFGIKISRYTSGYISNLKMYEADIAQNIIGTENVATAFGENGTFADWDVQPGVRWLELEKGCRGLYPGELPENYEGRTCGKLVVMPENYFVLSDPGEWWNPADVVAEGDDEVGDINGTLKDKQGKNLKSVGVKLVSMSGESTFNSKTDSNGKFTFDNIPVGGYNLYIIEDDNTEVLYGETVWIEQKGDTVQLSLTYTGNGINAKVTVVSGGKIGGTIVDKNGQPMSGLTVLLDDEISVMTDAEGNFTFDSVSAGIHSIYIKDDNGNTKIADIMVSEGVAYTITSSAGGAIVYDSEGKVTKTKVTENKPTSAQQEKGDFNFVILITVIAVVLVIVGITVLAVALNKKRKLF